MNDGPVNGSKTPKKERMRFVSAEQVAQLAGVSRSAVSRTFTPGTSVAPATREKVLQAAQELGYHVNDLARGVLANQSRLVGIVATRPEVGFRAHLAAALAKCLIKRGSIPILINTGQTEDELLAAQKMLIGHRAEAIIILSGSPPASFFELAQRNGQPLVVIGRSEPDADHVRAGNSEASRKAATAFTKAADGGWRSSAPTPERRPSSSAKAPSCRQPVRSVSPSSSDAAAIPTMTAASLPHARSFRRQ